MLSLWSEVVICGRKRNSVGAVSPPELKLSNLRASVTVWCGSSCWSCPLVCPLLLLVLSTGVSSVVDLAVSDHYCVNITSFSQQEAPVRTVRICYLTSGVTANFMETLHNTPAEILPASCDFIVGNFNGKLKSSLDSVAPLLTKTLKTKPTPLWRNEEMKKLKRNCRSAERKWRKTELTVHYEILREQLKIYNNAVKQARISHFARLITDHKNNPKILSSTIDLLR